MKKKIKVLVVGGGPAGATAATVLSRSGVEVILLEKNLSFAKPCGGGVPSVAFEKFDIPRALIKREVDSVRLVSPGGDAVDIALAPKKLLIVNRGGFDTFLRETAGLSGAEIMEGSFVSAQKMKNYYICRITRDGEELECEAEYVVAADGVNSRVRLSQGLKPNKTLCTISQRINGLSSDKCEFWFSSVHAPGFYSWVFPASEGVSIGTGCIDAKSIKQLFEVFKRRIGIPDDQHNDGSGSRIYRIPKWEGDLYNKGNIVFAGDSAGQVMPLSYEGIYYAMRSGECAAEAIIQGKAGLYRKIWESRFYKVFLFSSMLNTHFLKNDMNAERLVSLHRRQKIQEVAKNLWLLKEFKAGTIRSYLRLLGKLLVWK